MGEWDKDGCDGGLGGLIVVVPLIPPTVPLGPTGATVIVVSGAGATVVDRRLVTACDGGGADDGRRNRVSCDEARVIGCNVTDDADAAAEAGGEFEVNGASELEPADTVSKPPPPPLLLGPKAVRERGPIPPLAE